MFTIGSKTRRFAMAASLVAVTAVGVVTGRAIGNPSQASNPELGALRSEPGSVVMMGGNHNSLASVTSASEFIAVVRVTSSTAIKTSSVTSSITGKDLPAGHADVVAEVVTPVKGQSSGSVAFKHKAFFKPGSGELDSPPAAPALEVGKEYLVFVEDGWLAYPLGVYGVDQGKVGLLGSGARPPPRNTPASSAGRRLPRPPARFEGGKHQS